MVCTESLHFQLVISLSLEFKLSITQLFFLVQLRVYKSNSSFTLSTPFSLKHWIVVVYMSILMEYNDNFFL